MTFLARSWVLSASSASFCVFFLCTRYSSPSSNMKCGKEERSWYVCALVTAGDVRGRSISNNATKALSTLYILGHILATQHAGIFLDIVVHLDTQDATYQVRRRGLPLTRWRIHSASNSADQQAWWDRRKTAERQIFNVWSSPCMTFVTSVMDVCAGH